MYWLWVWCYPFQICITVDVIYYQVYAVICESLAAPCIIYAHTFGSFALKLAHLTSSCSCCALIELRLSKLLAVAVCCSIACAVVDIIQAHTFGSIALKLAHFTSLRSCPALIELRLGKLRALWFEWVVYTPMYLLLGRDRATARHTDICGALVARLYQ